jgi:hypothetical protein
MEFLVVRQYRFEEPAAGFLTAPLIVGDDDLQRATSNHSR